MAIAYKRQVDGDTEFALWKIEEDADTLYRQLQLNDQEKAYVEQLANGKRNLHWLSTRVLLRTMLNTDSYIDCRIDEHGKPYLVNMPYQISLSHSFDYAAVMISKSRPVGIDIEQIKEKVERIAPKFMKLQELAFMDEQAKIQHLYVCWCAKEAVYKCYGRKEVSFLDNIALKPFNYQTEGSLKAHLQKDEVSLNYQVDYLQYEDYMIGYVKG
ncbi:4'-phosphopantetheinyl transferase superfamily protein [Mucilaginibacter robiniae]|uniref:4'-phosphopantetheinyl transferase superfamily protein n=1 Tax=Mucilaginibacter robiniae TaxID=2728022 RepID=A0A7L5E169_9SPHI|nr:4'-phosphopantetheinyl transferase superfamily protein [Mucilaginibacter robiniae]QJD97130.1 4'-phosphopantetheinyl transferase superfamily protein [Mucilaginibacter robiniae]